MYNVLVVRCSKRRLIAKVYRSLKSQNPLRQGEGLVGEGVSRPILLLLEIRKGKQQEGEAGRVSARFIIVSEQRQARECE